MGKATDCQQRLDCQPVLNVQLNHNRPDEMIPILAALQHIYGQRPCRDRSTASPPAKEPVMSGRHNPCTGSCSP